MSAFTYQVGHGIDGDLIWQCADRSEIGVVPHCTVFLQLWKYTRSSENRRRLRVVQLFLKARYLKNIVKTNTRSSKA